MTDDSKYREYAQWLNEQADLHSKEVGFKPKQREQLEKDVAEYCGEIKQLPPGDQTGFFEGDW